ncbi:MAG: hypothetical protein Q8M29_18845 [Bacteroidota bacterium]|nr:hypothetical protein [Bacteroidota bacterium]
MQIRIYIVISLWLFFSGINCYGQRFIAMDVSKVTGFKRIKYYIGDDIRYKTVETNKRYKGNIVALSDSLIFFENKTVVNIKDIKVVYRDNANFVTRGLARFCFVFGPGFLGLDTFNNLINKRKPIINDLAVQEGAAFIGAGLILDNMMKRRYKIGKRRSIKIMDLDLK